MTDNAHPVNICIGCGLCCDGTLFATVPLKSDDDRPALAALGFKMRAHDGKMVFDQPCGQFSDGACSVYAARPTACQRYRCDLRERFDRGDVTTEQAHALIQQVKALDWYTSIRPGLEGLTKGGSRSLSDLMATANQKIAIAEDPAALRRKYGVALVRGVHLLALLRQHFRAEKRVSDAADESRPVRH